MTRLCPFIGFHQGCSICTFQPDTSTFNRAFLRPVLPSLFDFYPFNQTEIMQPVTRPPLGCGVVSWSTLTFVIKLSVT
uniref:Uncharacterized protein n=1 Tax=Arion vulgaris TaxID=1028688 RepID=A0A0B7B3C4_9EUPU